MFTNSCGSNVDHILHSTKMDLSVCVHTYNYAPTYTRTRVYNAAALSTSPPYAHMYATDKRDISALRASYVYVRSVEISRVHSPQPALLPTRLDQTPSRFIELSSNPEVHAQTDYAHESRANARVRSMYLRGASATSPESEENA